MLATAKQTPSAVDACGKGDDQKRGWRGSHLGITTDGIFENAEDVRLRKVLRRDPEVQQVMKRLWDVAYKYRDRMHIAAYMDFHLSVFFYIVEQEDGVAPIDEDIDRHDAWESAIEDYQHDTEKTLNLYGTRALHFDSFADALFELIDLYTPTLQLEQCSSVTTRTFTKRTIQTPSPLFLRDLLRQCVRR